jgi:hypothetical protein
VTVLVGEQSPIIDISVEPALVAYDKPSTLKWSSNYATSCVASGDWSGIKSTEGTEITENLISSKTYTITCAGIAGKISNSVTVLVGDRPEMTGTLTPATSVCIIPLEKSNCNINFSWDTLNPVDVSVITSSYPVHNTNVFKGNSGVNVPFSIKYNNRTFYLYNNSKLLSKSTVTAKCIFGTSWDGNKCLAFAPTVTLSANPTTIPSGGSTTLTWSSTNADFCVGTGFSTGNATAGDVVVFPTASTTYSIVCTGPGGYALDKKIIDISLDLF